MTAVSYDTKTRTRRTQYADGTESVIVYDECGNVLSATNESGSLSYAYDKAGLLIKETDTKTGETVSYFYDKAGRTICIRQVNSSDRLLSGEAYAYDKLGRRSMTVNEKGLVTIYKYDNQSRLETVYYPFNEDIKETARKEADKQGLYFQPSQGTAENYFLSTGELLQLKAVAECIANGRSGAITVNQVVWKESYTYDANGNRTSKTTAWGTVEYSYDKENRLVESGNLGMSESVKYTYDANGNLLRESAARYLKDYTYNAQNRMSFSDVQDSVLNTRNFTEYAYDAFGRRIETRQYLGDYTRNLYDGFSFDVIGKTVLQAAYSANIPAQKYRDGQSGHPELVSGSAPNGRNALGTEIGTRYRYIDDTPLVPLTEAGKSNSSASTSSTAKTRSRPNNEYVLYSYGEPVAMTNDSGTSYFGTDILGSVRNITDKYGTVQADYSYDAFGSPYLGNLENDVGFGFCGKSYDVGTGLYDYGFRDYSPVSARFTTVDLIRDGSNWFSYVVNDPVNYVDPFGLYVVNNSDSPIIIKLESEGYVILAAGETYDGRNVVGFNYSNGKPIDNGKIDGIIFANGRIEKFSDLKNTFINISVSVYNNDIVIPADKLSSLKNSIGDGLKAIANVGINFINLIKDGINVVVNKITGKNILTPTPLKEYSGSYMANNGTETGKWSDGKYSESDMNNVLNNNKAVFIESKEELNNLLSPSPSGSNNSKSGNNISFSNIKFDDSGSAVLSPTTDFSTRINNFAENAYNINPFNNFSGGCTK